MKRYQAGYKRGIGHGDQARESQQRLLREVQIKETNNQHTIPTADMEKDVDDCNGGISPLLYTCVHVASHYVTLTLATRARRLQAQQTNEQPSRLTGLRCNMTKET